MAALIAQELKNVARSSGGLTRWFKEKWVDVKTGSKKISYQHRRKKKKK